MWTCAMELAMDRTVRSGSERALVDAIRRGADLRVYTEFLFEEHVLPYSDLPPQPENHGLIREIIDFRQVFLIDDRYVAGMTTLRQPMLPTIGLSTDQPMMSFFMYGMDGQQSCANLIFSPTPEQMCEPGVFEIVPAPPLMRKLSAEERFDPGTSAPSMNFVYDMEVYRFWVRDEWTEILSHDSDGTVTGGGFDNIEQAQREGRELKVAIRDMCADLGLGPTHEVFTLLGSSFLHDVRKFYDCGTHPVVRVAPAIPMKYRSFNWDVCWASLRTTAQATLRKLDPYTRKFSDHRSTFACRWFVR